DPPRADAAALERPQRETLDGVVQRLGAARAEDHLARRRGRAEERRDVLARGLDGGLGRRAEAVRRQRVPELPLEARLHRRAGLGGESGGRVVGEVDGAHVASLYGPELTQATPARGPRVGSMIGNPWTTTFVSCAPRSSRRAAPPPRTRRRSAPCWSRTAR